jgi:hypothetical protein
MVASLKMASRLAETCACKRVVVFIVIHTFIVYMNLLVLSPYRMVAILKRDDKFERNRPLNIIIYYYYYYYYYY